jgi:hypothetical protein
MGVLLTATAGFILVIVLWSLQVKAIDASLIAVTMILIAAVIKLASAFLPGNRAREAEQGAAGPRPRA